MFSHWLLRDKDAPNPYADPDLRFNKLALGKRAMRYLRDEIHNMRKSRIGSGTDRRYTRELPSLRRGFPCAGRRRGPSVVEYHGTTVILKRDFYHEKYEVLKRIDPMFNFFNI